MLFVQLLMSVHVYVHESYLASTHARIVLQ